MPEIKILPEVLSNKIAAGEVVERPASVVKELVENAIDAKSTQVTVEVKRGGKTFIRVSDNGIGMDRDDSLLAIERYATSKIWDEEDLFSISTLGFRGEALPSIASVSELEIVTKAVSSDAGTRIVIKGGQIKDVSEVGAPQGTMITVNRLFFNTPARRKYLKSEQTEMGHISDTVTRMALALPTIHFKLFHNERVLGNWGRTETPLHRITEVLKGNLADNLYEVDHKNGNVGVNGFVASPEITRATSRGQYMYVNGRFVRDKVLHHAVMEGYAGRIMKGRFPVVVLFLVLPLDEVDVNVHPTKSSVRFGAPRLVHDTVAAGIVTAMQSLDRPTWGRRPSLKPVRQPRQYNILPSYETISEPIPIPLSRPHTPSRASEPSLWEEKPFSSLRVIGQLHNSFIVCESEEGLVLIDQHAAHERVVFESLKAAYKNSKIITQGLLIPEKLELSHREAAILDSLIESLGDLGVGVEPFGGKTYLVRSVPDILAEKSISPLIMEIIDKAAEFGLASGLDRMIDECLILMACHGAIRAKAKLSDDEMRALLKQLDALEDPGHCPHGRPTLIRQSLYQIQKDFKRIV
jgi:DNA mismatch repair protein MutL